METKIPVSRLTVDENSKILQAYLYVWMQLFNITAAWIVDIPEVLTKSAMGRILYLDSLCITALRGRILELRNSDVSEGMPANNEIIDVFNLVKDMNSTVDRLRVRCVMLDELKLALDHHVKQTDPLWDEPTVRILTILERYINEGLEIVRERLSHYSDLTYPTATELLRISPSGTSLFENRNENEPMKDYVISIPTFSNPRRDDCFKVGNALDFPKASEITAEKSLGFQLHSIAYCVEVPAVEICSYVISTHPELPWECKLDLARQVYDEARHTELLTRKVESLGVTIGEFPIHIHIWEYFMMGDNLVEQLCIQQVIQEGHGLDSDIVFSNYMASQGDLDTATLFDYIGADETIHVGIGCRWMRYLSGETEDGLKNVLEKAYNKLLDNKFSPKMPVQERERLIAGMTEQQVERAKRVVTDQITKAFQSSQLNR